MCFKKCISKIRYCFIVFFVISFCISINAFGIIDRCIDRVYPETEYAGSDFNSFTMSADYATPLWLKDITITEDGKFRIDSTNSWIYIEYRNLDMKTPLNLKVKAQDGLQLIIYSVESYQLQGATITGGEAVVNLGFLQEKDNGIRIDLMCEKGQTVEIDSITLNDTEVFRNFISKAFRNITIMLFCLIVFFSLIDLVETKEILPEIQIEDKKKKVCLSAVYFALMLVGLFLGIWEIPVLLLFAGVLQKQKRERSTSVVEKYVTAVCMGAYILLLLGKIQADHVWILTRVSDKILFAMIVLAILSIREQSVGAVVAVAIGYFEFYYFNVTFLGNVFDSLLKQNVNNCIPELNCLIVLCIYSFLQKLAGKRLGNLIYFTVTILYYFANLIKMKYQGNILRMSDFKLWRELFGIMGNYVPLAVLVFACVLAVGLLVLLIVFRKKIISYFKPQFRFQSIGYLIGMTVLFVLMFHGKFAEAGVLAAGEERNSANQISNSGFLVYTLFEFTGNNAAKKPEGYDRDLVERVNAYKDTSTETEDQPITVLILAESLFEVENVDGLEFNEEVLPNLKKYKAANCISPSYGGRTVVAKFEALTGLSNYYITTDESAYTSYMYSSAPETGSIAREFSKNGYHTVAIHANKKSFYDRDKAYKCMGFDEFIGKEDMDVSQDDFLPSGYAKDQVLSRYLIRTIADADQPTFIFGASIESHGPYNSKYETTEIKASSKDYTEEELAEVDQYAQAIHNFDAAMKDVFDYCDSCGKKVNIYIFGDHLPALSINVADGYTGDNYKKYCIPVYAYSNYKEISMENEYISTSKIAPQILRDAGISYNAYFDVIYKSGEKNPILQKEFNVDLQDESLDLLDMIQFDLLSGERYLLEEAE